MKKVNSKIIAVGKDETKGLQTPRFRLHIYDSNANDIFVAHYGISVKEVNSPPEAEITNIYKIADILNECIDDYHEKHKDD